MSKNYSEMTDTEKIKYLEKEVQSSNDRLNKLKALRGINSVLDQMVIQTSYETFLSENLNEYNYKEFKSLILKVSDNLTKRNYEN